MGQEWMLKGARRLLVLGTALWTFSGCNGYADLDGPACAPDREYGSNEGALIQNFALTDQYGDQVYLDDYCGKVIVLQMGAMWCPSCQAEARKIHDWSEQYGPMGLSILNLMTETPDFAPPVPGDLLAWADHFKISTPVLADRNWTIWERYLDVHVTPRAILIDRSGRIKTINYVITEEQIRGALQLK